MRVRETGAFLSCVFYFLLVYKGMGIDLASLTAEEKRALYDQLAYDLRGSVAPDERMQALWNDMHDALKVPKSARRGLNSFLEGAGNRPKLLLAVETMDALLVQALPPRCSRTVKIGVRMVALECLIDWLRAHSIPPTPATMLNNFDKLRAIVDQSFPGYIAAQMLHHVVGMVAVA